MVVDPPLFSPAHGGFKKPPASWNQKVDLRKVKIQTEQEPRIGRTMWAIILLDSQLSTVSSVSSPAAGVHLLGSRLAPKCLHVVRIASKTATELTLLQLACCPNICVLNYLPASDSKSPRRSCPVCFLSFRLRFSVHAYRILSFNEWHSLRY